MRNNMENFEELDDDLLIIKKLCENIKAVHEGKTRPWAIWGENYQFNEEKGVSIENYSPSGIPFVRMLKELGIEGNDFARSYTFFSYKELLRLYPKIPEILLALEEHRVKLRQKIDEELNKIVKEEREITKQAIIQFARS